MARVNRFVFNSDFMTVAYAGRQEVTMTIPAKELLANVGSAYGDVEAAVDIPPGCYVRARIKFTSGYVPADYSCDGDFIIYDKVNNRQIDYSCHVYTKDKKVGVHFFIYDEASISNPQTVLSNAQTFTLILDFLKQPNT